MRIARGASLLGCLLLGAMWILAAISKIPRMDMLATEIKAPGSLGWLAATALVAAELTIGMLLVSRVAPRPALLVSTALLSVFLLFEAMNRHPSGCGCFGEAGDAFGLDRLPVYRDLFLLAVSLSLYILGGRLDPDANTGP